ncbi:MAG: NAD-dependent epimerase/dehydratase family protein [Deltaproteobacteria bacterium]|jgi:nucleoside-diphosphate-sugar epimerase|nr:NAD-dependent epimerase/dehydratase family protein [Deltaproteobacteria bacterium]
MDRPAGPESPLALVTGGLGYIGQAVCESLLAGGFRVTCLDSLLHGQSPSDRLAGSPGFRLVRGDIRDCSLVADLAREPDVIIHLAALVGEAACDRDPGETLQVNLLAPVMLREAALHFGRAERLILASTDSCYGKRPGEPLREGSTLKPLSLYAELKARLESRLLQPPAEGGAPATTVLRLATVYGLAPRMRFDLAVNALTREAALKGSFTVFSGEQWRPLVHVRDAAAAFLLAAAAPLSKVAGEVFNVGANDLNIQFKDLGSLIASLCPGSSMTVSPGEPDLRDYRVDFSKIRDVLGYKPQVSLEGGISEIRDALQAGQILDPYSPGWRNA